MKIERGEKPDVKFEELSPGDVFEHEEEIYMKTDYSRERTSAVDLVFGCLAEIEEDTLVKRLNARLTVIE